jgi:hypothetical protein
MHVKLSVSTYVDLLKRLPVMPREEIPLLDPAVYPTFVHVLGAVPQPRKNPLSVEECDKTLHLCELYKHSQINLGKWLLDTQHVARYVERNRIYVYTSFLDTTTRSPFTNAAKRAQATDDVDYHVEQLRQIYARGSLGVDLG